MQHKQTLKDLAEAYTLIFIPPPLFSFFLTLPPISDPFLESLGCCPPSPLPQVTGVTPLLSVTVDRQTSLP